MPIISRITLLRDEICAKCKGKLNIGDIVVKDRTNKKKSGFTVYYHTGCLKQ